MGNDPHRIGGQQGESERSRSNPTSQTFYRIVQSDPPLLDDFLSYTALGYPPPNQNPDTLRLRNGLSVYERESQARRRGRGMPWLGRGYIAELVVPADGAIHCERTGRGTGHWTIWGDPAVIMSYVARVVPIRQLRSHGEQP